MIFSIHCSDRSTHWVDLYTFQFLVQTGGPLALDAGPPGDVRQEEAIASSLSPCHCTIGNGNQTKKPRRKKVKMEIFITNPRKIRGLGRPQF